LKLQHIWHATDLNSREYEINDLPRNSWIKKK
jgi:hypothetical protein